MEKAVSKTYDAIIVLQEHGDRMLGRFSVLRSLITPKLDILQRELEKLESSKKTYESFASWDLNGAHV